MAAGDGEMLSGRSSLFGAAAKFLKKFSESKRGAMAAWFALMLPLFLMGAALALDLSYLMMMKHKLQTAASASALAAAKKLPSKSHYLHSLFRSHLVPTKKERWKTFDLPPPAGGTHQETN